MSELIGLEGSQRTRFRDIVATCHSYRGKSIYWLEVLRICGMRPATFSAIVTSLRLSADYDALCELREALAVIEVENEHVEKAIKRIEEERCPKPATEKGPKMTNAPGNFELREEAPRQGATAAPRAAEGEQHFTQNQRVCLAIVKLLGTIPREEQTEVLKTAEYFTNLGA